MNPISLLVLFAAAVFSSEAYQISELQSIIVTKATECDIRAKSGDHVAYHYVGTFYDNGDKFDSSLDRGEPYRFTIDRGEVIVGMNEGIKGWVWDWSVTGFWSLASSMCIGEKRVITIPSVMAYGEHGYPPVIPPNADLVFQVEMLQISQKSDLWRSNNFVDFVNIFVFGYLLSLVLYNKIDSSACLLQRCVMWEFVFSVLLASMLEDDMNCLRKLFVLPNQQYRNNVAYWIWTLLIWNDSFSPKRRLFVLDHLLFTWLYGSMHIYWGWISFESLYIFENSSQCSRSLQLLGRRHQPKQDLRNCGHDIWAGIFPNSITNSNTKQKHGEGHPCLIPLSYSYLVFYTKFSYDPISLSNPRDNFIQICNSTRRVLELFMVVRWCYYNFDNT